MIIIIPKNQSAAGNVMPYLAMRFAAPFGVLGGKKLKWEEICSSLYSVIHSVDQWSVFVGG